MRNVLKKLAVCLIAMAMLVMVRAVLAPDVSAKAGDTYTIAYVLNGGTLSESNPTSYSTDDAPLTLYAPTKTGYKFNGWYNPADKQYLFDTLDPSKYSENLVLRAVWAEEDEYLLRLYYRYPSRTTITWKKIGEEIDLSACEVDERTGYTFVGWNTQEDGNGTMYNGVVSNLTSKAGDVVTLYATWVENASGEETKYSISYVLNGGTNNSANPSAYTGSSAVQLKDATRKGYAFGGWYKDSAFTTKISTIAEGSSGDLTLYAKWTPYGFQLVLDGNGSTSGSYSDEYWGITGGNYPLPANVYKRTGYTFTGWNTKKNGSGESFSDGETITVTPSYNYATITLYAQWKKDTSGEETSYSISYVLNGGTNNSANPSSYTGSSAVRLKDPTRTGYTFDGWYKDSAFKTQISTIAKGSTGNLTLYAKWTKDTSGENSSSNQESDSSKKQTVYTIVFDGNGSSSGSMADMEKCSYGSEYSLTANKFKKTGYTFAGWNTKADGSGTSYKNKASVKNLTSKSNGSVTLYAQWTLNKYTIMFDGNGSTSGSMSDLTDCKYTSGYKLTANKFKKTGYAFAGWNTKKDGSGTSYKNKASVKKLTSKNKGTVTLYAQWTQNRYTITFDGNGSTSGSMSDLTDCRYTSSYKLTANKFKKTGYTFAGWNTKKDGSGKTYKNKASVKKLTSKNGGTVTLYAQWTAATYSIKYVLNGGTNSDSNPSSYTYGNAVTLNAPTRSGYTFLGWYTDKNLTRSITTISAKASGKLTLYAGWKKTKTTCTTCGGSGTVPCGTCGGSKTTETKCDTCHGLGYNTISGQGAEVCGTCDGAGTISTECTTCNGKGEVTCSNCGGTGTK